jgi:hypothetical protein
VDGTAHTIVLQVAINEKENQDVAVFTVQKDAQNQVQIQLVGDEELYGKNYIIEPNYGDIASAGETPNPGYTGKTKIVKGETIVVAKTTYVEVASWPLISYLFVPSYVVWHSPWYWGYYPSYWNPWHPYYWDYYFGYHSHFHNHYYGHYRHSYQHRYPHYNDHYYLGHRSTSNTVHERRQSGAYSSTYSRPETQKQGSADFIKRYPDGYNPAARPGTNSNIDRQGTKLGIKNKENRQVTKPATNDNAGRPGSKPGIIKPANRQGTDKQNSKSDVAKPSTRPTPSTQKQGVTKQSNRSSTSIPGVKSNTDKRTTKSSKINSSTKPATTKSDSKPAATKSSSGQQKSKLNATGDKPRK